MKSDHNFFAKVLSFVLLVLVVCPFTGLTMASSIHDPFIQEFQIGAHSDPDKVDLIWGYPSGLLEMPSINTAWTDAGLKILGQKPSAQSPYISLRILDAQGNPAEGESWVRWHRLRIQQLVSWQDTQVKGGRYLLAERLTMGFFRAYEKRSLKEARQIADRLADNGAKLHLNSREIFVWKLRRRLLDRMLKDDSQPSPVFWSSMLELGSYDLGNAWALWTAHRRLNGFPAFPHNLKTRKNASSLSTLRKSWISEKDIQNSAFSHDTKSALGARLLKKQELNRHLASYPNPPQNFQMQGWWVSGQRTSRRGVTEHYETLANRTDLKPGWQMDLFRRASEIHLLNGRWESGLNDLGLALDKAAGNSGTVGQRRRLRQWTEQALVLALAMADSVNARRIYDLGDSKLPGEQNTVFKKENRNWASELGLDAIVLQGDVGFKDELRGKIKQGNSVLLKPMSDVRKQEFALASSTPLWILWARWGSALLAHDKSEDLVEYRSLLDTIQQTQSLVIQEKLVIAAVALIMKTRLDQEPLLRWILDKDIHHLSSGQSLTAMSPISGQARKNNGDSAALHALLGIALLADDMRGIVGAATPMPQTGLTKREKLCFLYPLPRSGSTHGALSSANSDVALLLAVARNESLFEPSVRSRAGALGWMQIMPFHFPDKGGRPGADNWSCAAVSIAKGDGLLKENRRRYNGNPYLTLAAYNAGPGAVSRWQKQLGASTRDDIFLAWIGYPETRHYVEKVLIDREIYDWIISESRLP